MKSRLLAAAALVAVATPALALGLDSRRSPYPPEAYSGFVGRPYAYDGGYGYATAYPVRRFVSPAYRYSGPHAGGPADALPRY